MILRADFMIESSRWAVVCGGFVATRRGFLAIDAPVADGFSWRRAQR
jgi:hypothetical protein